MLLIIGIVGHDRRPLAALLPAVLCHRQAHHAPLDQLRAASISWIGIADRHRRRGGDHGFRRRHLRRPRPGFGNFTDAGGIARGPRATTVADGRVTCFAIALIDAAIIGAAAVGLATATPPATSRAQPLAAPSRGPGQGLYACYAGLIGLAPFGAHPPGSPRPAHHGRYRCWPESSCRARPCFLLLFATTRRCSGPGSTAGSSTRSPE